VRGDSKRSAKEAAGPPPKRARAGDKASAPAIFTGLVLFVSVGPNVSMKWLEILRDLVHKHGGGASGALADAPALYATHADGRTCDTITKATTHVLMDPADRRVSAAVEREGRTRGARCLDLQWLSDCARARTRIDEARYTFAPLREESPQQEVVTTVPAARNGDSARVAPSADTPRPQADGRNATVQSHERRPQSPLLGSTRPPGRETAQHSPIVVDDEDCEAEPPAQVPSKAGEPDLPWVKDVPTFLPPERGGPSAADRAAFLEDPIPVPMDTW
jgi:hypothetical protein